MYVNKVNETKSHYFTFIISIANKYGSELPTAIVT